MDTPFLFGIVQITFSYFMVELAIILIGVLLILLISTLNLFHSLLLSQKKIKLAKQDLNTAILSYLDKVAYALNQHDQLSSETSLKFFGLKETFLTAYPDTTKIFEIYSEIKSNFNYPELEAEQLKTEEILHTYNHCIISLEHKLAKSHYKFLAAIIGLKPIDSVIG